jgi:hypothetical protein
METLEMFHSTLKRFMNNKKSQFYNLLAKLYKKNTAFCKK